jgi:hypothetical protein
MTQLPVPVHVGSEPPEAWDDIEARQKEYGGGTRPPGSKRSVVQLSPKPH